MTRAQFLNDLYRRLGGLSKEQAEQHLTYYAEMLADRMEEGMSEAEAVASMEDVDTIAQRILQDEGAAQPPQYATPVRQEPFQNPAVPEKKRDWRRPVRTLLWALAILVVAGSLLNWISQRFRPRSVEAVTDSDIVEQVQIGPDGLHVGNQLQLGPDGLYVGSEDRCVSIGPDGIEVSGWEDWDDWEDWEDWSDWTATVEDTGYGFPGQDYAVAASGIHDIEIEWLAGLVDIQTGDSETISFREDASQELTAATQLVYGVKDGKLRISFWRKWQPAQGSCAKRLTLYIPSGLLDGLEISSVSSSVVFMEAAARSIEVETTSGDVSGSAAFQELDIETTSGNVDLLLNQSAREMDIETVSGDITLLLDGDFTLEFDTASGALDADGFAPSRRDGKYISGNGTCKIEVTSISGDLLLSQA